MEMTIKVESADVVAKEFALRPKQIERASRLTINQITSELHKELGSQIPLTAGASVTGFRKARAKKKLAKAKERKIRGVVWLGTKSIAAKHVKGKMRHIEGYGAAKGQYVFKDSFVQTMPNGYTSIFRRTKRTKSGIEEETISLPKAHQEVKQALLRNRQNTKNLLAGQLKRQFEKRKQ